MSYLVIDEEQMTTQEPVKKRDHRGKLNPHYNCPMSDDSKKRISSSQSLRYSAIRQLLTQKQMTEEKIREIIKEKIQDYLSQNAVQTNNNKRNNIPL